MLRRALVVVLGVILGACGAEEPKTGSAVQSGAVVGAGDGGDEDVPANCPVGMVEIAPATVILGEWSEDRIELYLGQVLVEREYVLDGYCIDQFPFPGRRGDAWTTDELSWSGIETFSALAEAHGRRLCTVAELVYAGAGPENWRYPYDEVGFQDGLCDPSDVTPVDPIGALPTCTSPHGVQDFMVRSTWGVLDEQSGEDLRAFYRTDTGGTLIPGDGVYAVWGGSSSQGTFYAPDNYGVHFYGPEDPGYINESVRSCAPIGVPAPEVDDAWAAVQAAFASDPRWARLSELAR